MNKDIIKEENKEINVYSKSLNSSEKEKQNEVVKLIMRHTNYDKKIALSKLEQHNNNIENIIREYMKIPIKTVEPRELKTTNQTIYNEFRTFLDDASKNYRENQKDTLNK